MSASTNIRAIITAGSTTWAYPMVALFYLLLTNGSFDNLGMIATRRMTLVLLTLSPMFIMLLGAMFLMLSIVLKRLGHYTYKNLAIVPTIVSLVVGLLAAWHEMPLLPEAGLQFLIFGVGGAYSALSGSFAWWFLTSREVA